MRVLTARAETARRRLKLLYDAGGDVGTSLDVVRTAEELAAVAVPRFADFVTVDLADQVIDGDEPAPGADMRRTAVSGIRSDHPLYPVGRLIDFLPSTPRHGATAPAGRSWSPTCPTRRAGRPRTRPAPRPSSSTGSTR